MISSSHENFPQVKTPNDIDTSEMRPVLIRHRFSGVWIGYIAGLGTYPNMIELVGRRIWQWNGGRLELSQVAKEGCKEEDRLGEWEVVEIAMAQSEGIIELRTVNREVVEHAKTLAADGRA